MLYRRLGHSGVKVSAIGLGTNQFGSAKVPQDEVDQIIGAAIDAGVNHLDTADMYQSGASEEALGKALRGRWEQVVLATKCYMPSGDGPNDFGLSCYHTMFSCENSLRRLQTDHVDLYYVHRFDEDTPLEETLAALSDLVRQGKVRYIGCSNWAASASTLAEAAREPGFVALQNHYQLLERAPEGEPIDACSKLGVDLIPFLPLAGGFLTGKYRRGEPSPKGSRGEGKSGGYVQGYMNDANYDAVEKLTAWAAERGRTAAELAHAWLLASPTVSSVISGAASADQVVANAKAADWVLTAEERSEVGALAIPPTQ